MVSFPFHIIKHFKNLKQDKSFGTDLEESMNISKLAQIRPHKTTTKRKFCVCQKSAHTKIHKTATKITYRPSRKGMHKFGARDIAFSWMLVLTVATDNADVSYLHPSLLCLYIVPLLLPQIVHSVRSRLCPYGG
jgi:hypothetical protein